MTIFGERDLWAIEVDPLPGAPAEPDPGAAATWCSIRIWVEGKNLSAHTYKSSSKTLEALQWPAVYLARWLVRSWSGLWERAGWPLPGPKLDAEHACRQLDRYLADAGMEADDELIDQRDDFVRSHSLLAASGGGLMPPVYLLREGSTIYVTWREPAESASDVVFHHARGRARVNSEVFLQATLGFLQWCGEVVQAADPKLATEIELWTRRIPEPEAAEAVLDGYIRPWGVARTELISNGRPSRLKLPDDWRSAGARLNPAHFPAAVVFRALTPVMTQSDAEALLERLLSFPANLEAARRLERQRSFLVPPSSELPHEQGYSLAEQLREIRGNPDGFFDIEELLSEIGVAIVDEELADSAIDGATVWSAEHGPVIVVNRQSRRTQSWARRMTLAHELCHLLVDRGAATGLVVASTPWAPPEIEKRANAFAAELLLPKAGILRIAGKALRFGRLDEARESLMEEFGIGLTVCDHQLTNRLQISD